MKKKAEVALEQLPAISESQEMAKVVPIRTETTVSQLPFHRLSKSSEPMKIAIVTEGARGKVTTQWEVSANSKYGEPGLLAYKLDKLLIDRLIDETRPNIPQVLKLGSLADIARELGQADGGENTNGIKRALHQNASAYITANLLYQGNDGKERKLEFGATRYEVIFYGEKLPDGRKADAVYVVFHHSYYEMLNQARTRPLDYRYIGKLPPAAHRLYELIAPQMYAAIKHGNPRAKYLYSELCQRAPLTRYKEWEQVKKQLYKIHQPHKEEGYIAKVEFQETVDAKGVIDWVMWYTPGRKARAEFKRFNTKEGKELDKLQRRARPHLVAFELLQPAIETPAASIVEIEAAVSPVQKEFLPSAAEQAAEKEPDSAIVKRLIEAGVTENVAHKLASKNTQECERQLDALPYRDRVKDKGAYLVKAIRDGYAMPPKMEAAQYIAQETPERQERVQRQEDKQMQEMAENTYFEYFAPEFREFQGVELERIKGRNPEIYGLFKEWLKANHERGLQMVSEQRRQRITIQRAEEFFKLCPQLGLRLISFGEWDKKHNPNRCDPLTWFSADPNGIFEEIDSRKKESRSESAPEPQNHA